jgi:DNA replication licensing factor MCM7
LQQKVANRSTETILVNVDDVQEYDEGLAEQIVANTRRYAEMFSMAIDEINTQPDDAAPATQQNVLDIFIQHRNVLAQNAIATAQQPSEQNRARYPPRLLRRYQVLFNPSREAKTASVRQVDAAHIGKLVTIEGIVTRATSVKPSITVATYACDTCGTEIYQEVNGPSFMPKTQCESEACVLNRRKGRLHLQTRGSKFERFQEIKIQELSNHVPVGSIPRSMTIHCYGSATRQAVPGDQITVAGVYLPVPAVGFRAMRAGLLSETFLEAQTIVKAKVGHKEQELTEERLAEIEELSQQDDVYDRLAGSMAPAIYGHDDIKKALLLLLTGGVERDLPDGMHIRGDINICLMGDPGVAKSQMLKAVTDLAPRGIYTTGRGSSGVGLTAAVTRDQFTGEFILEGGALVLADNGVCAIDEFDKMDESDRTAIHEVMEQQTVSIAKAGITTQLNARTSILAAANPLWGRYDPKKSASKNINLPPALLSRFDLLFLLLDKPDHETDLMLAKHITHVHQFNDFPPPQHTPVSKELVRNYITEARRLSPYISKEVTETVIGMYIHMREESSEGSKASKKQTYTSARSLLAILRLASAYARLRMSEEVHESDIIEAVRLMHQSKASLDDDSERENDGEENASARIFEHVKRLVGDDTEVSFVVARRRAVDAGYNDTQFAEFISFYEGLGVFSVNETKTKIRFDNVADDL